MQREKESLSLRTMSSVAVECHALEKSAADPNEASWEYGVLISAKTGAGGTRDSGERPRGGTEIVATC